MKIYNDTDFQHNKIKNAVVEGYTATADLPAIADGISIDLDTSTYVITVSLKKGNTTIATSAGIDLPLETMVVSGSYDSTNKKIILTLKNGQTIEFSVADLVSGLVATSDLASVAFSGDYDDLDNKPTIPDISGKADKVTGATANDFAGLDANGNLTDSGYNAASFLQPQTDLTTFDGTMHAGKTVVLATALASLTVTAIENGYLESNLIFAVSGTAFALTLPTGTKVAGTLPTFEAGGEYVLSAFKGIVVCAPLTAA